MVNSLHLNLANVPKELRLIIKMLQDNNDISQDEFQHIDWNLFLTLTKHHRIYPLLHKKLKELDTSLIPPQLLQDLSLAYKRNTFQMLQLSGEMEQVSTIFSKEKISVLFLKGPVIADDLYGDISLRTSNDLDVLIPLSQLEKAENILEELGYVKDDYIETILGDWTWRHHHTCFIHPQKKIKVELHWRLNPGPSIEPSFQEMWGRKRKSNLTSSPVYLLGKEDLFLFLVSHGARHGWSRLRWLVDIKQLLKQDLDCNLVEKIIKKYHHLNVGGQAVILATCILKSPVPNYAQFLTQEKKSLKLAQEAIFYLERMVNLHTDPVPMEVSTYHQKHLYSLMSWKQKVLFILSFLFPYPEDAKTLPLPKPLHFLYFPLRPFLWAWRKYGSTIYPRGN